LANRRVVFADNCVTVQRSGNKNSLPGNCKQNLLVTLRVGEGL